MSTISEMEQPQHSIARERVDDGDDVQEDDAIFFPQPPPISSTAPLTEPAHTTDGAKVDEEEEEDEEDNETPEIPDQEGDGKDDVDDEDEDEDDDGFVFQCIPCPSKGDSNKGAPSSRGEDLSANTSRKSSDHVPD
ncbi:hypothetical protein L6452_00745 [Arctium lappa]|uniref:Uncharacterized protein n=1 Tax=Arctium lappa TaxID=4217 RepID=A0ACB9FFK3_ARCLA|nr:hypothetical protein L6452_00745 [Arctium lappa]